MKIYFISGLGADHRVFKYLTLPYQTQHISWVTPEREDTIQTYSKKLISQINTSEEITLIGVSFGGIICQEIAKFISCKHVIIISSIKNKAEMEWQLQLVRKSRIDLLFPASLLKLMNLITGNYYFNVESPEEAELLKTIIRDTDPFFMKWAINAIMRWDNKTPSPNLMHIHGTHDRVFPPGRIKNYFPIEKGGHFMIVNRATEINEIICKYLR